VLPSTKVSTKIIDCVALTAIVGFAGVSFTELTSKLANVDPKQLHSARIDNKNLENWFEFEQCFELRVRLSKRRKTLAIVQFYFAALCHASTSLLPGGRK
jgi:hypothetical protein